MGFSGGDSRCGGGFLEEVLGLDVVGVDGVGLEGGVELGRHLGDVLVNEGGVVDFLGDEVRTDEDLHTLDPGVV